MILRWMSTMIFKRGDIVIAYFPFSDLVTMKKRPALIVQADNLKTGFDKVIIAQISSQVRRAGHPSRVLISMTEPDSSRTGLKQDSVILTDILASIDTALIDKKIGMLADMAAVNKALKVTLGIG